MIISNHKIWLEAFDYLTLPELARAGQACRAFYEFSGNKNLLKKFFPRREYLHPKQGTSLEEYQQHHDLAQMIQEHNRTARTTVSYSEEPRKSLHYPVDLFANQPSMILEIRSDFEESGANIKSEKNDDPFEVDTKDVELSLESEDVAREKQDSMRKRIIKSNLECVTSKQHMKKESNPFSKPPLSSKSSSIKRQETAHFEDSIFDGGESRRGSHASKLSVRSIVTPTFVPSQNFLSRGVGTCSSTDSPKESLRGNTITIPLSLKKAPGTGDPKALLLEKLKSSANDTGRLSKFAGEGDLFKSMSVFSSNSGMSTNKENMETMGNTTISEMKLPSVEQNLSLEDRGSPFVQKSFSNVDVHMI